MPQRNHLQLAHGMLSLASLGLPSYMPLAEVLECACWLSFQAGCAFEIS